MYLISLEICDIDLFNGICYMLVAILHPEIQHDQCKPTKHLNSFDTHCMPDLGKNLVGSLWDLAESTGLCLDNTWAGQSLSTVMDVY